MFDWDEKKNDEKGGEQMGGKIIKAFHSLVDERRKMGWVIFHFGPQTSFSLNFRKKWGENVQARNALYHFVIWNTFDQICIFLFQCNLGNIV